tara:strand:- start:431 stop:706 length:276 start_codon:yes stop_codon:yes gene_type:complete
MNKIIILILVFLFNINTYSFSNSNNCEEFKKFSLEYFKCKGSGIKDKTISSGQNIINDTKDYQNKEWSEEKEKMNKVKNKMLKTKEKILNQ